MSQKGHEQSWSPPLRPLSVQVPTLAGGHGNGRCAPEIDIQLLPIDNPPKGIGGALLPVITSCVGKCDFPVTSKRFRDVPLLPERRKAGYA